jgi:chromosome partitioning protein
MHLAVALTKSGQDAATIDLDTRQKSFTRYIDNRRAWARQATRKLDIPEHFCFGNLNYPSADEEAAGCKALEDTVDTLADRYGVVVIDTPGHDNYLARHAHSLADILITPLNDSFVDLDVLGTVDPETQRVIAVSHYAQMVEDARGQRRVRDSGTIDWIVLRNRLSTLGSRNKRLVGEGLQELSRRLNFRHIEGLAERVIFREFYPRGLTAVDDLDEATLNARPTMSHITARLEMLKLLAAMGLDRAMTSETVDQGRDAA